MLSGGGAGAGAGRGWSRRSTAIPIPESRNTYLWAASGHLTRAWSATGSTQLSCLDLAADGVSDGARVASSAWRSIMLRGLTTQTLAALRA